MRDSKAWTLFYKFILWSFFSFSTLQTHASETLSTSLDWPQVQGASGYQIKFTPKNNQKPQTVSSPKSKWKGPLQFGLYDVELRSKDERGVFGPWSEPFPIAVIPPAPKPIRPLKKIGTRKKEESYVHFQWTPVPGVKNYWIQVESLSSSYKYQKEILGTETKIELPVAQSYRWKIASLPPGVSPDQIQKFQNQKFSETSTTVIGALAAPKIISPTHAFIEHLKWEPIAGAQKYLVKIYRKTKKGKWKRIRRAKVKKPQIRIKPKWPAGQYKAKVTAYGLLRKPSKGKALVFELAKQRGPKFARIAELKESVSHPARFHAVASYIITQLDYLSLNKEKRTRTSFSALGGSGRLGLGFTPQNTHWGAMAFAEYSGFTVSGQTFTYFTLESQVTYRKHIGTHLMKLSSGLFLRQLPETQTSVTDSSQFDLETLFFAGPQVGFSYGIPFSSKIGLFFQTQLYYSLVSLDTPNNKPIAPTLSYQINLLGSYRLNPQWTGMVGYTFKKDSINYKTRSASDSSDSFAESGDQNSVEISGHYLSLHLEWNF